MPKLQLLGHRLIARQVGLVEVIQQPAALADHFQQTAPRAVVLDVLLQMLGQVVDALGQKGDLHVRGACVLVVKLKSRYRLSFFHIVLSQSSMQNQFKEGPGTCKALF